MTMTMIMGNKRSRRHGRANQEQQQHLKLHPGQLLSLRQLLSLKQHRQSEVEVEEVAAIIEVVVEEVYGGCARQAWGRWY
jgi:hypothetical protein